FLRSLALLRWEQGRPVEAQVLLSRAVQTPKGKRPSRTETALCQVALGLLHLLEVVTVDPLFLRLRPPSAAPHPPHQTLPSLPPPPASAPPPPRPRPESSRQRPPRGARPRSCSLFLPTISSLPLPAGWPPESRSSSTPETPSIVSSSPGASSSSMSFLSLQLL